MREVILPFPEPDEPLTGVRGTLLVSSLNTLRLRGHFDRYRALLPPKMETEVLTALASSWCSLDLARTHYATCDALQLSAEELVEIGQAVGNKVQSSFLGTVLRRARSSGLADPWLLLPHMDRIWARMFLGGGTSVLKTGPKDALVQLRNTSLLEIPYFRNAFVGVLQSPAQILSRKIYCRAAHYVPGSHSLQYSLAWV
jgi:hypothetical protein